MKLIKYILIPLLFFVNFALFSYQPTISNVIEQFSLLEPILTHPELDIQVSYDHLYQTIDQLAQLHDYLTKIYLLNPTPEIEEQITIVNTIFFQIQSYMQELINVQIGTSHLNNQDPNYQQPLDPQQIAQAQQQQQIINNLISAIDQSNQTIEKLTRPKRWRYVKIGAYMFFGTAVVVGITAISLFIYKKVCAFIQEPFDQGKQHLNEKAEQIGDKTEELIKSITPIAEDTRVMKKDLKQGIGKLDNVLENDLPKLKKDIEDKLIIYRLLYEQRHVWKKRTKELEALKNEVQNIKSQQYKEKIINDLQTKKICQLSQHKRQDTKTLENLCNKLKK